jgi:hypothetical protein
MSENKYAWYKIAESKEELFASGKSLIEIYVNQKQMVYYMQLVLNVSQYQDILVLVHMILILWKLEKFLQKIEIN